MAPCAVLQGFRVQGSAEPGLNAFRDVSGLTVPVKQNEKYDCNDDG